MKDEKECAFLLFHPSSFLLHPYSSLLWSISDQLVLDFCGKRVDRAQIKLVVVAARRAVLGNFRRENDFDAILFVDDFRAIAGDLNNSQRSGHRAAVKIQRRWRFRAEIVDLDVYQSRHAQLWSNLRNV